MIVAADSGWTAAQTATLVAAGLAAIASLINLWIGGLRQQRAHRRELYADALAATMAYREFPYAIRRRRHEEEHRSAERVRISEALRLVQADLSQYEALVRLDAPQAVASAYRTLVAKTREIAGGYMHEAWRAAPITRDEDVNQGVHLDYAVLRNYEDAFLAAVQKDLSWYRFWR